MNPLKKIYCRTFQTGLKIALPFLPYRKPKIVGSAKALPEVIQKKKCSKVLIITDAGIRKLGLTRRLEKALVNADIPCCIYDKTVANPTTDNVAEAMEIYQNEGCDCIIGFGGGSSMDCAKAVGGEYNVPHGLANAVILPMLLEAYGEKIHRKLSRLAIAAGLADEDTPCDEAAGRFIQAIKDMKKRFGIGDKIPEIQETDIPKLAHYADKEANPLYPVPVLMDASELEPFYRKLMTDTGEDPDKRPDAENNISGKGAVEHDGTGN